MDTRRCTKCEQEVPMTRFYKRASGHIAIAQCKPCHRETMRAYQIARNGADESAPAERTLYIACNPRIPGEIKVGRSNDPQSRIARMSYTQNFDLALIASFPDLGSLETHVHRILSPYRVQGCREWSAVSLEVATAAVMQARAADTRGGV